MMRSLRAGWERVALYLPLVLMAVLALGTYWLVRSTPMFESPAPERAPGHEPDYFARQFALRTFDPAGHLKNEVFGSEARHYRDTDTLEIDQVRIRAYDGKGHVTVATARRALANGDASQVQLIGDALVVREPGAGAASQAPRVSVRSEFLHADLDSERVRTNQPVELTRGADRFTADGMELDNVEQTLRLLGRVRGTLAPKRER